MQDTVPRAIIAAQAWPPRAVDTLDGFTWCRQIPHAAPEHPAHSRCTATVPLLAGAGAVYHPVAIRMSYRC